MIAGVDLSAEPDEVADILIDLAQRETKNFSAHFARTLVGELKTAARLHKHPLKSAGFKVLKAPDVPSVLVELGYVSNKHDLKLMTSEAWRAAHERARWRRRSNSFFSTRLAGACRPGRLRRTAPWTCDGEAAACRQARDRPQFDHKTARLELANARVRAHIAHARPDRVSSGRNGRFAGGHAAADGLQ